MRNFNLLKSRTAAVVTGAVVVVGLGTTGATAAGLINSDDIRNNSIAGKDISRNAIGSTELGRSAVKSHHLANGAIGFNDLRPFVQNQVDDNVELDSLRADVDTLTQSNNGVPGQIEGLQTQMAETAGNGVLAAQNQSDPANRTVIQDVGGTVLNKTAGEGATPLTSIELDKGTYLISAYGHFDRLGDTEPGYETPTTDTYGALVLWTGAGEFTDFAQAAGTYFTGAISQKGFVEATASGSQVLTVTEPTVLHVGGFGYNEDRSGFGTGTGQFSAIATVSAVQLGEVEDAEVE
jgi:hypothetical protein